MRLRKDEVYTLLLSLSLSLGWSRIKEKWDITRATSKKPDFGAEAGKRIVSER